MVRTIWQDWFQVFISNLVVYRRDRRWYYVSVHLVCLAQRVWIIIVCFTAQTTINTLTPTHTLPHPYQYPTDEVAPQHSHEHLQPRTTNHQHQSQHAPLHHQLLEASSVTMVHNDFIIRWLKLVITTLHLIIIYWNVILPELLKARVQKQGEPIERMSTTSCYLNA